MGEEGRREPFGLLYRREIVSVAAAVKPSAAVLYAVLVTARNAQTGETPPLGIDLLARQASQTRRTVFRGIAELESAGLLARRPHGKRVVFGFPLAANGDGCDTETVPCSSPRTKE